MEINETKTLANGYHFTGVLEIVDCIDYHNNRTIFRKTGLRNTFLSIFPDRMFQEPDFHFYMNMSGTYVILEVHNVHTLKRYIDALSYTRILGIDWGDIYQTLRERHQVFDLEYAS